MTEGQLRLISSDPLILRGQARVTGTRVTVSVVLDCVAAGMRESDFLAEYPSLTIEGIRAAAAYGAALAREDLVPLHLITAVVIVTLGERASATRAR
ncbi:MAG: DUF433 domain-containing protein [Acidimicrobiia bacterium]